MISHCMDMPGCVYLLITHGNLVFSHILAIISDATIEIHVQVLVCKYICVCVCSLLLGILLGVGLLSHIKTLFRASLVAQWLRVCRPMQGTRVRAPVWEDPACRRAAGSVSHNYWAWASGACAPQRERPWWWGARAPRWRVAPACHN